MKVAVIIILLIKGLFIANCQDIVFKKNIKLKHLLGDQEAYPIPNSIDNSIGLFLINNAGVQGLLLDKDFNVLKETEGDRPKKFSELLGSNIQGANYTLFFSGKSHRALSSVTYNFDQKTFTQNGTNLIIQKEDYIGAITYKNKFYFLSIPKKSSTLKVYIFDSLQNYSVKSFDFPKEHFKADQYNFTLSDALHDYPVVLDNPYNNRVVTLDNEIPNALYLTSALIKLYCYDDKIVLTFNTTLSNTRVITVDINTLESSLKVYSQPVIAHEEADNVSANSYIYKSFLYQMKVCNNEMAFTVLDLNAQQTIKEYKVLKNEEITFANTPIIRADGEGTLSKTKQFLRKVASVNAAISAYQVRSNIQLTLGGFKEVQRGTSGVMSNGAPYVIMTSPPVYNPTYIGFNSYIDSNLICFKSLVEVSTFEHQSGIVYENSFDKIKSLTESLIDEILATTVLKKDGDLILGYYLKNEGEYIMRRYKD